MSTATIDDLVAKARRRRQLPAPAVRRLLREQVGLTQADLAAVLGVDRATVARYELGRRAPHGALLDRYLDTLARLAVEVGRASGIEGPGP